MAGGSDRDEDKKSSSRCCAFCGAYLCKTCTAVVAYSSSSAESGGSSSKAKPLRWRFLSSKSPRSKLMCGACAEKRNLPVQHNQQCSDPSHHHAMKRIDSLQKVDREELSRSREDTRADPVELLTLQKTRRRTVDDDMQQRQLDEREVPRRHSVDAAPETTNAVQEPTTQSRKNTRPSFSNHRMSRESLISWYRPSNTIDIGTRNSATLERSALETPDRSSKTSSKSPSMRRSQMSRTRRAQTEERISSTAGMSRSLGMASNYFEAISTSSPTNMLEVEPLERQKHETIAERTPRSASSRLGNSIENSRQATFQRSTIDTTPDQSSKSDGESSAGLRRSAKNRPRRSQTEERLSSTADILGMSRGLKLPFNYFQMSSASPTFSAESAPELKLADLTQQESPSVKPQAWKKQDTEEERQRRRSASYAKMLVRMRRHYEAVQVNGCHALPATAPPRRQRAARRAKSVASQHMHMRDYPATDDPVKADQFKADPVRENVLNADLVREGLTKAGPVKVKLSSVKRKLVTTRDLVTASPAKKDLFETSPVTYDPVKSNPASFGVDLAYLDVYKDAR